MNDLNISHYFYTNDLALATVLSTKHKIIEIDQSNPTRVEFCFERTDKLVAMVADYRNYAVLLPPQEFLERYKNLKIRIMEQSPL